MFTGNLLERLFEFEVKNFHQVKSFRKKLEESKMNSSQTQGDASTEPSVQPLTTEHIQQNFEQDASVILD